MPLDKTVNGFCTGELYYVEDNLFSYEATETFLLNWVLMEMLPFFVYSLVSLLLLYYFVVVVWMFGVPHNVIFHPHHQTSPSSSAWLCKRFVCCAPNPVVMSIYYISLSVSECVSIYYMSVCNGICGEACSVRGHLLLNMHHRLKKKSGAHYSWCCEQRVSKFARIAYVQ